MDGATDVDALAEALRVDGVVVERTMGSGEAQAAEDRIAALVRELPFPVYVALVAQPDGLPGADSLDATDALAGLLSRRLGDGMYVVHTDTGIQQVYSFGLGADPSLLGLGAGSNDDALEAAMADLGHPEGTEDHVRIPATVAAEAQVLGAEGLLEVGRGPFRDGSDYPASLTDAQAEGLARRALAIQETAEWRPGSGGYVEVRTASRGFSALAGGLTAIVVALLLGQTLRGWPRHGQPLPGRTPRTTAPPDPDTERARARELVDALVDALEQTDWSRVHDREVADRALTARDASGPLLESDDVADLIGAQVVARTGSRDLARGRRGHGDPWRACFFDPRHPAAKATVSWRLGDGEVDVPCCTRCAAAVASGATPEHLRLGTGRRAAPYWERDDVWARTGFGAVSDDLARDVLADRAGER